jgi:hypothetical protein
MIPASARHSQTARQSRGEGIVKGIVLKGRDLSRALSKPGYETDSVFSNRRMSLKEAKG